MTKEDMIATLEETGQRYAEMFVALGLGDPDSSVGLEDLRLVIDYLKNSNVIHIDHVRIPCYEERSRGHALGGRELPERTP